MKILSTTLILSFLIAFTVSGCSSHAGTAGLGVVGGAAAAGGGYEYNAKRQRDRIAADLQSGKIDQKEYDIRLDQINRGSMF
jgi:hypothetical protein